ncbi:GNAT family N-acetyltransferase [Desulfitobacterium metallireducens]|uniref:GCN5 family acetyltransferase n=1 Tax=Desulfitobacterium metallireducens DSM 15288 TaxID=871968 RepID=W0E945_9FIRM|nr:GNAT family N-acetyltransferase [Desulfitobacterium metallireducens]AHF07390.1 GCN5 family acetyltransferase [Desulfitobacterium metallireducens DSM 15288]
MLTLQNATVEDLESLSQLYKELSGEESDPIKMKENFNLMESNPNYVILTAKEDKEVVGSIMGIICLDLVLKCQPFMVIENVIVKNTWRGRGIGESLMEEIEKIGRTRNCYYTMLVSAGHRKGAHKFYEAIGYNVDLVRGFKKYL